jgi:hypothetical protein
MSGRYMFFSNVAVVTASTFTGAAGAGCGSATAVTTTLPPHVTSSFIWITVFCMNEIMFFNSISIAAVIFKNFYYYASSFRKEAGIQ